MKIQIYPKDVRKIVKSRFMDNQKKFKKSKISVRWRMRWDRGTHKNPVKKNSKIKKSKLFGCHQKSQNIPNCQNSSAFAAPACFRLVDRRSECRCSRRHHSRWRRSDCWMAQKMCFSRSSSRSRGLALWGKILILLIIFLLIFKYFKSLLFI